MVVYIVQGALICAVFIAIILFHRMLRNPLLVGKKRFLILQVFFAIYAICSFLMHAGPHLTSPTFMGGGVIVPLFFFGVYIGLTLLSYFIWKRKPKTFNENTRDLPILPILLLWLWVSYESLEYSGLLHLSGEYDLVIKSLLLVIVALLFSRNKKKK